MQMLRFVRTQDTYIMIFLRNMVLYMEYMEADISPFTWILIPGGHFNIKMPYYKYRDPHV